jgi:hypothetical protein
MRFMEQCSECGGWKWCGQDCEMKPDSIAPSKQQEIEIYKPTKFDRRAHMRAFWEKKRNARFDT